MRTKSAYGKCIEITLFLGVVFARLTARLSVQRSPNTITFKDRSGDNAVVELTGPVHLVTSVPNLTTQAVNALAANYYAVS